MRHLSIVSIFFLTSFTTIACGGAPFGSFPGGPDGSQNDAGDAETSTVTIGPPDATTSRDSGEHPDATKDATDDVEMEQPDGSTDDDASAACEVGDGSCNATCAVPDTLHGVFVSASSTATTGCGSIRRALRNDCRGDRGSEETGAHDPVPRRGDVPGAGHAHRRPYDRGRVALQGERGLERRLRRRRDRPERARNHCSGEHPQRPRGERARRRRDGDVEHPHREEPPDGRGRPDPLRRLRLERREPLAERSRSERRRRRRRGARNLGKRARRTATPVRCLERGSCDGAGSERRNIVADLHEHGIRTDRRDGRRAGRIRQQRDRRGRGDVRDRGMRNRGKRSDVHLGCVQLAGRGATRRRWSKLRMQRPGCIGVRWSRWQSWHRRRRRRWKHRPLCVEGERNDHRWEPRGQRCGERRCGRRLRGRAEHVGE